MESVLGFSGRVPWQIWANACCKEIAPYNGCHVRDLLRRVWWAKVVLEYGYERETDRLEDRKKEQEKAVLLGVTFKRAHVLHRETTQLVVTAVMYCTCCRLTMGFGICRC